MSRSNKKIRQSLVLRLRQEIVQLTRDVQHLARFIGVQRTGFRKLLKKYKKWSHSSSLSEKFLPILEAPTSFTNQDFTSTFLELSLLYNVLRQAKLTSITVSPHVYPSNEKLCMFDCEMITAVSNAATFWIHPDNMVETKITLLRNLSLVSDSSTTLPSSSSHSNLVSLNLSSSKNPVVPEQVSQGESSSGPDSQSAVIDHTYITFLDNSRKFYSIQTNTDPGQIHSVYGTNTASTPVLCSPVGGLRHFCIANLSSEQAELISKSQYEALGGTLKGMDNMSKVALSWVQKRQASPIAKMASQRTRFRYSERVNDLSAGSSASSPTSHMNSPDIWATLDTNIKLTKTGATDTQWPDEDPEDVTEFPHCVLEIRWKGLEKPLWLSELESSHLVYQVKGFSMYAHSVAHYYPNSLSVLPQWLTVINEQVDIRKAPKRRTLAKRGQSMSSISINTPAPVAPGILLNNERQPLIRSASSKSLGKSHSGRQDYGSNTDSEYVSSDSMSSSKPDQPVVRYWNEFDDPEDGAEEGVFVVIPDEDLDDGLFNDHDVAFLVSLGESLFSKVNAVKTKIQHLFGYKPERRTRRGLATIYEDEEDDDDEDTEFEGFYSPRFKSHHGHIRDIDGSYFSYHSAQAAAEQRNSIIAVLYSICFFLSALMVCTLLGVLLGEDMNAISMGTYVFIVSGFFIALGISVLAMGLFFMRADMPPWWHQTIVFSTFFSIICFGVGGVAWLFS